MLLLDKREAAALLKTSTISIDRYRKMGLLPCRRFGSLVRFTQSDIDAFITRTATDKVAKNENT